MILLVGIDSGSSKTAALLCDEAGRVLGQCRSDGCALHGLPTPAQCDQLRDIADDLCRQAGVNRDDVIAWGAGLNGIDFADEFTAQHESVVSAMGINPQRLHLVNDGIAALWGATSSPTAILIQHGSGLTSAYRSTYGNETIFDHLDVGRLFDMRQELLAIVARMLDGREPRSPLADRLLEYLEIDDPGQYAERVYRRQIAPDKARNTPSLVYEAWEACDRAATRLIDATIADYVTLARAMVQRLESAAAEIVFGGGVVRYAPQRFWSDLDSRLCDVLPGCVMRQASLPPQYGAVVMASHHAGIDPHRLFDKLAQHHQRRTAACHATP